jgi:hypothetical protein
MHTVSFGPQSIMEANIHHQCLNLDLKDVKHLSIGINCNRHSNEEVYASDMVC